MPTTSSDRAVLYAFKIEGARPWYLLLHRADGQPNAGSWEVIEAVPNPGEKSSRAAIRTLVRATHLDPQALWALDRVETSFDATQDHIRHRPIYAALVSGDLRLGPEYDSSRWFSHREALAALRSPQQRATLEEIHGTIGAISARGEEPDPRLRIV